MRSIVALCALTACAGYQPGSFAAAHRVFPGQHLTAGCLDLAVAQRTRTPRAAVLVYDFGNRCDHPAVVDLAAVHAIGRTIDGRVVPLYAHDPNHEIRPLPIDGRRVGREAIAYEADTSAVAQVCIDAGAIAHARTHWLCFARRPAVAAREVTP